MGAVVVGAPAGAARRAHAASPSKTLHVAIPLPAPGTSTVSVVPVKVTAAKGKKVGTVRVSTANDSQLGTLSAL